MYVGLGWGELAVIAFFFGFSVWHYWEQRKQLMPAFWSAVVLFIVLAISFPILVVLASLLLNSG